MQVLAISVLQWHSYEPTNHVSIHESLDPGWHFQGHCHTVKLPKLDLLQPNLTRLALRPKLYQRQRHLLLRNILLPVIPRSPNLRQ
jgi:hypothetical protein